MNKLLEAAKAVIADWDERQVVGDRKLRAAVEHAEKQEAVGFEEWWDANADLKYKFVPIGQAKQLWTAAQQAERERLKEIVGELLDPTDPWIHYSTLLDRIDGPDDDSGEE